MQRLAHDEPRHTEALGELSLGRERRAGRERAVDDRDRELVVDRIRSVTRSIVRRRPL
jgi:hypothetical protein